MESHKQQQLQMPVANDQAEGTAVNGGKGSVGGGFVCTRQSSSRWTPTTDQIRILKELYYNNGVRSPTAEQIQRITAKLRQYGKIEGKNVFYWFQNHKARERQKKRFIAPPPPSDHHHIHRPSADVHFSNIPPAGNFSTWSNSSTGFVNVGSVGNCGYGSMAMEKSFRECSINPSGSSVGHSFAWIGVNDPSINSVSYPTFLDKRRYFNEEQTLDFYVDDQESASIETLPLFPMSGDINFNKQKEKDYFNGWPHRINCGESSINGGTRASLELTLNFHASP